MDLLRPAPAWEKRKGSTARTALLLLGIGTVLLALGVFDLTHNSAPKTAATTRRADYNPVAAYTMCYDFVRDRLVSPGSAKFPLRSAADFVTYTGGSSYKVETWVDAQNVAGAFIRTDFLCAVTKTSNGKWRLDNLDLKSSGDGAIRPRP